MLLILGVAVIFLASNGEYLPSVFLCCVVICEEFHLTPHDVFSVAASCNPDIRIKSYTATDTLVLNEIAFVADITLTCKDGSKDIPIYAAIGHNLLPVTKTPEPNRYLISWTEKPTLARSGSVTINFYDDNGYVAFRKALRSGGDSASVAPLTTANVNVESSRLHSLARQLLSKLTVVLLRGPSGSGKSTFAAALAKICGDRCVVLSTDDFFTRSDGSYQFTPALLQTAHFWNRQRAKFYARQSRALIVIDNTNLALFEMVPYLEIADEFGYRLWVKEPPTSWRRDPDICSQKSRHGVINGLFSLLFVMLR
ncbi:unnamed protein product [Notodromas monacha]|uniref:Uncharacterized protein n=1 Tax=Notodromas monacha TaxID=399045 RepID=A0A7R9BN60_9CRUS|nr:unnamed protein product [Notodromas monacha]CAG0917078.1 unnamed protein product [Notodromas monacha]